MMSTRFVESGQTQQTIQPESEWDRQADVSDVVKRGERTESPEFLHDLRINSGARRCGMVEIVCEWGVD